MTVVKRLGKTLGGKWQYTGSGRWECDDGKLVIQKCSPGVDQFDEPLKAPAEFWLYGDGSPRRAERYVCRPAYVPLFVRHDT